MFPADILIIGGGIQGLVLLDELTRQDYACVLVTNADLGGGQTLHSHGLLNSGSALLTGHLQDALATALSFARHRGLQLYGEDDWFALAPPPAFEQLRAGWEASNYEYRELSRANLPLGFQEGDLFRNHVPTHVIGLRGYNFPKRQLVRLLSEGHTQRIIRGDVASFHRSRDGGAVGVHRVDVRVQVTGDVVAIAPQAIVAAAGTGTTKLLKSIVPQPTEPLDRVTYSRVHMVCIWAPQGVLPATTIMSLPHGLISVAHVNHDHDHAGKDASDYLTWYVTPAEEAIHDEHAPDDARADVSAKVVAQGMHNLLKLYPPLKDEAGRAESKIRFGVYAGYKQGVGDQPTPAVCDLVAGTRNVFVALPSVLANAWGNAQRLVAMLHGGVSASGPLSDVPGAGVGVRVGAVRERTDEVTWMSWTELAQAFPGFL